MTKTLTHDVLLNIHEVVARTGLSRATIDRMRKRGSFPRPTLIGERCLRWSANEIGLWIEEQLADRLAA